MKFNKLSRPGPSPSPSGLTDTQVEWKYPQRWIWTIFTWATHPPTHISRGTLGSVREVLKLKSKGTFKNKKWILVTKELSYYYELWSCVIWPIYEPNLAILQGVGSIYFKNLRMVYTLCKHVCLAFDSMLYQRINQVLYYMHWWLFFLMHETNNLYSAHALTFLFNLNSILMLWLFFLMH